MFAAGGWGGSDGQKITNTGLPLQIFFRKRGMGVRLLGVCAFNQRNMVKSSDLPMPNSTQKHQYLLYMNYKHSIKTKN